MNFFKKKSKFQIEFYPSDTSYYPKHNNLYLAERSTGISQIEDIVFADSFDTENAALDLINKFKEQQQKEKVIIIPVD